MIDLCLLYYDNHVILRNWFHRLAFHSDFQQFEKYCNIYIADTGTPLDKIEESLNVCNSQPQWLKDRIIYVRAETEEIRKQVPLEMDARPLCHVKNLIALDISQADVILTSMIGHIFTPKYFNGHFVEHIKDPKAVVLPKRFDLFSDTYHSDGFKLPFSEVIKGDVRGSGGLPDMSVRRKWLIECGGSDEWYKAISCDDMDLNSRLTGKCDNNMPSEILYPEKGPFNNLGLNFVQPFRDDFFSLTCNTYPEHRDKNDSRRQLGYELSIKHYLENWGIIYRNLNRKLLYYKILNFRKNNDS